MVRISVCVGSACHLRGALVDTRVTTKLVDNFAAGSAQKTASDNEAAEAATQKLSQWHKKQ